MTDWNTILDVLDLGLQREGFPSAKDSSISPGHEEPVLHTGSSGSLKAAAQKVKHPNWMTQNQTCFVIICDHIFIALGKEKCFSVTYTTFSSGHMNTRWSGRPIYFWKDMQSRFFYFLGAFRQLIILVYLKSTYYSAIIKQKKSVCFSKIKAKYSKHLPRGRQTLDEYTTHVTASDLILQLKEQGGGDGGEE